MSFTPWNLRSARSVERKHRRQPSLRAATHRPRLEVLEDCSLPSFVPAPAYAARPDSSAVAVADFNSDGVPDMAVANYTSDGTVSILLARRGGYRAPVGYAAGSYPTDVIAADFNGDGLQDIAVVNSTSSSNLRVL